MPSDLFDALAKNDLEGLIYLYAAGGRKALQALARMYGLRSLYKSVISSGEDWKDTLFARDAVPLLFL